MVALVIMRLLFFVSLLFSVGLQGAVFIFLSFSTT